MANQGDTLEPSLVFTTMPPCCSSNAACSAITVSSAHLQSRGRSQRRNWERGTLQTRSIKTCFCRFPRHSGGCKRPLSAPKCATSVVSYGFLPVPTMDNRQLRGLGLNLPPFLPGEKHSLERCPNRGP